MLKQSAFLISALLLAGPALDAANPRSSNNVPPRRRPWKNGRRA